jgi:hypothetical protein
MLKAYVDHQIGCPSAVMTALITRWEGYAERAFCFKLDSLGCQNNIALSRQEPVESITNSEYTSYKHKDERALSSQNHLSILGALYLGQPKR